MSRAILASVFVALLFAPWIVQAAQDRMKSPFDYSIRQYMMILGFAMLGGAVSWYNKVRAGIIPKWSVNHLVGELCTSAFSGLIGFLIFDSMNFPEGLTAALAGVCGHMGTRAIGAFEKHFERKLGVDVPADEASKQ